LRRKQKQPERDGQHNQLLKFGDHGCRL
jgi:hypothetical protein